MVADLRADLRRRRPGPAAHHRPPRADLIGVLPLYQKAPRGPWGARQLRFISTGEAEFEETCAEYLDLLHVPGAAAECVAAVGRALTHEPVYAGTSSICLRCPPSLRCWSCARPPVRGRDGPSCRSGRCVTFRTSPEDSTAYLNRLSQGAGARRESCSGKSTASGMVFELAASAEEADRYFDQMVELHGNRWTSVGKSGSFSPRHAEFHRSWREP